MSTPLRQQLADLDTRVAEAIAKRDEAKKGATNYHRREANAAPLEEMITYWRIAGVGAADIDPTAPAYRKDAEWMTAHLVDAIESEGLLAAPAPNGGIILIDPRPLDAEREAEASLAEARAARDRFKAEHAADFAAEKKAAERDRLRTALDDLDPAALREALAA